MSDSNNDNLCRKLPHDHIVWKALKRESLGAASTRCIVDVCEGNNFRFEKVEGRIDTWENSKPSPEHSRSYQAAASIASSAASSRMRIRRTTGYQSVLACAVGIHCDL
jgi:hypothetical protein